MIKLNDIVVKFGDFTALHNINVHVKEGEFFTFLGPSGCGKTTTLRTITGFIEPVSGTVVVKDRDITHVPIEERNIGIVFQSYALFPTMTVYDNIAFGLKIKKLKKAEIDQKVREIAKKVDLSDEQLMKAVSQLSGGQQQRVAIARALVTGPAIICMDDEQIGTPNEVYNFSKTEFVCNFIGDINRLSEPVVQKMIDAGANLKATDHNYIRLERMHVNVDPRPGQLAVDGTVTSREYYGLYIKYYIDLGSQTVKVIEKNDGVRIYEVGQQVKVIIDPRDVMAYPPEGEAEAAS